MMLSGVGALLGFCLSLLPLLHIVPRGQWLLGLAGVVVCTLVGGLLGEIGALLAVAIFWFCTRGGPPRGKSRRQGEELQRDMAFTDELTHHLMDGGRAGMLWKTSNAF